MTPAFNDDMGPEISLRLLHMAWHSRWVPPFGVQGCLARRILPKCSSLHRLGVHRYIWYISRHVGAFLADPRLQASPCRPCQRPRQPADAKPCVCCSAQALVQMGKLHLVLADDMPMHEYQPQHTDLYDRYVRGQRCTHGAASSECVGACGVRGCCVWHARRATRHCSTTMPCYGAGASQSCW